MRLFLLLCVCVFLLMTMIPLHFQRKLVSLQTSWQLPTKPRSPPPHSTPAHSRSIPSFPKLTEPTASYTHLQYAQLEQSLSFSTIDKKAKRNFLSLQRFLYNSRRHQYVSTLSMCVCVCVCFFVSLVCACLPAAAYICLNPVSICSPLIIVSFLICCCRFT